MNPKTLFLRGAAAALAATCALSSAAHDDGVPMCSIHTSRAFAGPKANTGTVAHEMRDGAHVLTLSADFKVPDAPAPQWQVLDSSGNVYFLQRLLIKPREGIAGAGADNTVRSVVVPEYVSDVKSVRIWCAWAEANLGQADFDTPIEIGGMNHRSEPFSGSKVNRGTVSHGQRGGSSVLILSDDFAVPDSPAPHWQIVDSAGRVYLLDSLRVKGGDVPDARTDRVKREIVVPGYVPDVAKVQFWCAWAETLLGEARFAHAMTAAGHIPERGEALALGPAPGVPVAPVVQLPGADVQAAFLAGRPLVESDGYKIHASRRGAPGEAEIHEHETDVIHVLGGSATIVTGGTVPDASETGPGERRGSTIVGGQARRLGVGDVLVVPAGTPHWFKEVDGPLTYFVVKVVEKGRADA